MRPVHRLCEFYPGICLTTEEKHGKTSVRVRKTSVRLTGTSVRVQYTFTKAFTHYETLTKTHITKPTHTHTLQNPHIYTRAHTHTHITKQYKTTIVQINTKCNRKNNTMRRETVPSF